MRRPVGVMAIVILIVASSTLILTRSLRFPVARMGQRTIVVPVLLSILALIAVDALWRLRSHAFLAFTLWALCATVGLVVARIGVPASGHRVLLFGPVVYAGLVYAVAAFYLRRLV